VAGLQTRLAADYTERMGKKTVAELAQSAYMALALARAYAAYRVWMVRQSPDNPKGHAGADDICIYYHCYGRGDPVQLLHGGFMCVEPWVGQIPALARDYRVIVADSRGHGRTTLGEGPLSYRRMAKDAAGLIARLAVGPVHLIGWSDGGCTGLRSIKLKQHEKRRQTTWLWQDSASAGLLFRISVTLRPGHEEDRHWPAPDQLRYRTRPRSGGCAEIAPSGQDSWQQ
jgi:hypothetical protein